jgi:heme-degrading monooxygenase HmoA
MFAVMFEVEPKPERRDDYLKLAAYLKAALEKIDGFISVERFASTHDHRRLLSLSLWRDEKSVIRWRTVGSHNEVQAKGRSEIFHDYHLRVGEITRDTGLAAGETPQQSRFDETEVGAAKFVTFTEARRTEARGAVEGTTGAGAADVVAPDAPGLLGAEWFDSIHDPGKRLLLASWRDAAAAGCWEPAAPVWTEIRHRHVRVIRDYGMFDRREAPRYYPPVQRDVAPL